MEEESLFLGIDLGSSFVKFCLINQKGEVRGQGRQPQKEMEIESIKSQWAEQDPQVWWSCVSKGIKNLLSTAEERQKLKGIGISYQMHGLVLVDQNLQPLRKSIIWCDSRASQIGANLHSLFQTSGLSNKLINHPSNFTISKLMWVKQNEPQIYHKTHKFLLPGDYIALKITGQCCTTETGLSEAVLWDFQNNKFCQEVFSVTGISKDLVPKIVENFSPQYYSNNTFNAQFGFEDKIPILYRSGDQPNNAFSLNVLEPGEVAATGGTSGVIYAVTQTLPEEKLRYNSFLHINHTFTSHRIGRLLCINGCGRAYEWMKKLLLLDSTYEELNQIACYTENQRIIVLPFGNGAQRMLSNQDIGCQILGLQFGRNGPKEIIRATVQGIAFGFVYGMNIMRQDSVQLRKIKAGKGNMFECEVFCQIIATLTQTTIEVYDIISVYGCAMGALKAFSPTLPNLNSLPQKKYIPIPQKHPYWQEKYLTWQKALKIFLH